jgi:hypothetical protein
VVVRTVLLVWLVAAVLGGMLFRVGLDAAWNTLSASLHALAPKPADWNQVYLLSNVTYGSVTLNRQAVGEDPGGSAVSMLTLRYG